MKNIKMPAIVAIVFLLVVTAAFVNKSRASVNRNLTGDGFAVLELFTSEGCSSCPPADDLLARVQKEAGDKSIYVLAYHVDYWDRLGWKDKFSNPQYSKRQYQYSRQFTGQVYTPQLIINGKTACVGSDENAVRDAISSALSSAGQITLKMQGQQHNTTMDLDYSFTGKIINSQLVIAVVQKHAVSAVKKGENEGRVLSHVQIVRDLITIDPMPENKGIAHFKLPDGFNTNDWELIGLIQNSETGVISAASRASLTTGTTSL